jgi:hypothetical protein
MRASFKLCVIFILLTLTFAFPITILAEEGGDALKSNPAAEQWIMKQVRAGESAYLYSQFPDEKDRVIRAEFLLDLLDNVGKDPVVARQGICVSGAIVLGNVTFEHRDVGFAVNLPDTVFENNFSACRSHFQKTLSLVGSHFKGTVNLCGVIVDDSLFLNDAVFDRGVDAREIQTRLNLNMTGTSFPNAEYAANFSDMAIGKGLDIRETVFKGEANFGGTVVGGNMVATDTLFSHTDKNANFDYLSVGKTLFMNRAVVNGPASFRDARIGGDFMADDIRFANAGAAIGFYSLSVGNAVYMSRAEFNGPASFGGARIGGDFVADDIRFANADAAIAFNNLSIGNSAYLSRAEFNGPISFWGAQVKSLFVLAGAKFTNPAYTPAFNYLNVEREFSVENASFAGPVDFTYMNVGLFNGNGVAFNSRDGSVNFGETVVKLYVFLKNANFFGPFTMIHLRTGGNLELEGASFDNRSHTPDFSFMDIGDSVLISHSAFSGGLDFGNTNVGRNLSLTDIRFTNPDMSFDLGAVNVGSGLFLTDVTIAGPVSFSYATVGGAYFEDVAWPLGQDNISQAEFQYQHLTYWDSNDPSTTFLYVLNQSRYYAKSYYRLEKHYVEHGKLGDAALVSIYQKNREREESMPLFTPFYWLDLAYEAFILYGFGLPLALFWMLLIVVIGFGVFHNKDKMSAIGQTDKPYRPFLYSLDMFLPIINLGWKKNWAPRPERKLVRLYAWCHRWIAWVLIPLAIYAIIDVETDFWYLMLMDL